MKFFTSTALVALLTASTAIADNHDSGDAQNTNDTNSESSDSAMSGGTDMSTGADEMYDDNTADASENAAMENLIRARDITGSPVYSMGLSDGGDWDMAVAEQSVDSNWNEIGEIEDVVLSQSGELSGVVAEVGGFLDIADKHVVLPINDVKLVPSENMRYAIVTRFGEEQLQDLENVDESPWY